MGMSSQRVIEAATGKGYTVQKIDWWGEPAFSVFHNGKELTSELRPRLPVGTRDEAQAIVDELTEYDAETEQSLKRHAKRSVAESGGYTLYTCPRCGHEVHAMSQPSPIRWSDGHVCHFVPQEPKPGKATPVKVESHSGLNRRDKFAAAAMQGLLADPEDIGQEEWPEGSEDCPDATTKLAVKHADKLIKNLK